MEPKIYSVVFMKMKNAFRGLKNFIRLICYYIVGMLVFVGLSRAANMMQSTVQQLLVISLNHLDSEYHVYSQIG